MIRVPTLSSSARLRHAFKLYRRCDALQLKYVILRRRGPRRLDGFSVSASAAVLLFWLAALAPVPAQAHDRFLALGTAYLAGTYFPVGEALCRRINRDRDEAKMRYTLLIISVSEAP